VTPTHERSARERPAAGTTLDAESIAAFIDHRLSDAQRDRMSARLADDPDARYLLAEVSAWRSTEELGDSSPGHERRWWSRALLAAALLAGVGLVFFRVNERPRRPSPQALAALAGAAGEAELRLPATVGARAFSGAESRQQRAAGLAIAVTDLAALAAGESAPADPVALRSLRQLAAPLELESATRRWISSLSAELVPALPPPIALDDLAAATDETVFEVALWLEVQRLLAHNGLPSSLGASELDAARSAIAAIEWGTLDETAQRLETLMGVTDPESREMAAIEHAADELLSRLRIAPVPR
jgi:hypothetical protein